MSNIPTRQIDLIPQQISENRWCVNHEFENEFGNWQLYKVEFFNCEQKAKQYIKDWIAKYA